MSIFGSPNARQVNFWVSEYPTIQVLGHGMPYRSIFVWFGNALKVKVCGPGMPYRSVFREPECLTGEILGSQNVL